MTKFHRLQGLTFLLMIMLLSVTNCARHQSPNHKSVLTPQQQAAMEQNVLIFVNQYRRAHHLSPLQQSAHYAQISRQHCLAMQRKNDIHHKGFSKRAALVRKHAPRARVSENVGFNYGYTTPEKHVVDSWINSPGHRVNMQGNYHSTGIGVTKSRDGKCYFSQLFVNP